MDTETRGKASPAMAFVWRGRGGGGGRDAFEGRFGTKPSCNDAALLSVGGVHRLLAIHTDLDRAFLRRGPPGSRRPTKAAVLANHLCLSIGGGAWHQHIEGSTTVPGGGLKWSGCSVRIWLWLRLPHSCHRHLSNLPMFGGASARGLFSSSSLVPVSARCIRFLGSTGLCVHPGQRSLPSRGAAVAGPIRPH